MNQGFANNSLFIGDLSKFCTESNLESLFSQYGPVVDVKIKRNNTTGKTLSYGFVTFANDECATAALENLNGYSFFGRNLRIRWAVHNAKAQKTPEESVINSVYVRFITPKVTEYITEEDFHRVFDPFGSILDCSIKESSIDQRTNRQSGYGFVHFTTDHAGIAAAFQAVSALDNATVHGVTYNVELSKNLLKQFNEMKMQEAAGTGGGLMSAPSNHGHHHHRNMSDGSMGSLSSLGSHGSQPGIPGPPMPQYGGHLQSSPQQPRWPPSNAYADGPRGYPTPLPALPSPAQFAQQQSMYPPQAHLQQRGGAGRANNGYMAQGPMPPMGNGGMMYNSNITYANPYHNAYGGAAHGHAQPGHGSGNLDYLLNSSPHAPGPHGSHPLPGHLSASGQMQGPYSQYRIGGPGVPPAQQPGMAQQQPQQQQVPPQYQVRQQQGQPLYGISGEDSFAQDAAIVNNRPGAYLAAANLTVNTSGPLNLTPGPGSNKAHSPAGSVHTTQTTRSLASSLDHHSLGSGADSAPFFAGAPPTLSPVPGRTPRAADALLATTGGVGSGSGGNSIHSHSHSHSGYVTSLAGSVDDESLLSHSQAAYSPYRTASPVFENSVFETNFDIGLSLSGAAKPPPLNLVGLGMHSTGFGTNSANSGHSGSLHCGSMANSSGGNSPIPTDRVRGGLNERLQTMKLAPSPYGTWDESGHVHVRAESTSKPPTPAANRAVGTATQAQTAQGRVGANFSGSNPTSQSSTPTNASGKSLGISIPSTSPKSSNPHGALPLGSNPGIGGISASLAPPSTARSGMMSRSSSTSSASAGAASSLLSSSGSASPPPFRQHSPALSSGLNSAVNSARYPAGLSDLDVAINRSISSSASDRNILSSHNTTDGEGGFFNSSNSSLVDSTAQAPRREQQTLASSLEHAELTSQMLADHTSSPHGRPLGGRLSAPLGQAYLRARDTKQDPYTLAYADHLHEDMKQSSLQSMSSIGEEEETDFHDDELVYSAVASPYKQPNDTSSDSNFTIDTAFMLSPQNSTHSLGSSPFASYSGDSFRGRPPAGGTVVSPLTASNLQGNALATALLRRSYPGDAASTATDDEVELGPDDKPQPRPLSLSSNESSQLAGIAIGSSTSSDADYQNGAEQGRERSLRPEKMRLDRNSETESAAAARPKQSRQLSLTQFFKPAQAADTAAAERTALSASK